MNNMAVKIAASGLLLGVTTIGCTPTSQVRPVSLSAKAPKASQDAPKAYALAEQAMRQGDFATALIHAEDAVAAAPSDVGYRMSLADIYLKNGRFASAETTFSDVLTLNPGNVRATLNLALVQIALGKNYAALVQIDRLAGSAPAGDVGLAYALAGQPQRAIEMLEAAAREQNADGRTRQNLALSYALAGDWEKARVTAAQDISPAELNDRLSQWASFAQPTAAWTQVAGLLGVTPAEDLGQPTRLALAPAVSQDVQLAAAPAPAPVEVAQAETQPPASESVPASIYAAAAQSLVVPAAPVIQASAEIAPAPIPAFVPRKAPRIAGAMQMKAERAAKTGRYVVQIGAYRSAGQVETAWDRAHKRYDLAELEPLSTTVTIPGRGTFHRLSVSGFETPREASQVCGTIRAKGGACFVRVTAGDAPVRWASRASARG